MKTKIFTPIESMNPIYLGAADDELYEDILQEHNGKTFAENSIIKAKFYGKKADLLTLADDSGLIVDVEAL